MKKAIGMLALSAAALMVTPAMASAGTSVDRAGAEGEHCAVMLEPLEAGRTVSDYDITCADTAEALDARTSAGTLLMVAWEHADYHGWRLEIRGYAGPCDAAGYGFRNIGHTYGNQYNDNLSSFQVAGGCNDVTLYEHQRFGGDYRNYDGNTNNVGDEMNDETTSIRMRRD